MNSAWKIGGCLLIVVGLAAAGLYGTGILLSEGGSASASREAQPIRVGLVTPEIRSIEDTVTAVGTLMAIRKVDLVTSVPGRVTDVPVASGQEVSQGDLLVQLDDRAARGSLAEAEATLRETRLELQRFEKLADSNTTADARLEEVQAAFRRAEAAEMSARANLEDRSVTAPFAGTLGLIDIEPGAYLEVSTIITALSDLSVMEVAASLPERYFEQVQPGQTVQVKTPAYPDRTFEGRVTLRAPGINLASRSFDIRAEVDNPDRRLVGGMFANSRIVLDTYDGLAIPDDAIISEGLTSYVYTVADGKAARTEIDPGTSVGALTEVRKGLAPDDRIVVAGWDNLTDGAPVEIDEDFTREGLN